MRHLLAEALHLVAGLVGTALFASLAAWAVPLSAHVIWDVALVAMVAVAFLAIRPLRLAWRTDRGEPIEPRPGEEI